ncbi:MAG: anaerobic sulfatase maturase [Rhizomicrobium sp.]
MNADELGRGEVLSLSERPYHMLVKPAGAACNLGCQYCFFLSKEKLYPKRESPLMHEDVLESYIQQLINSAAGQQVEIAWQGGEPTLRGLDFFKLSVTLAERYRKPHQHILHTLQTNGTLIDDEWALFLKENNYLVGLSIDGPQTTHDTYRVDKQGQGSFDSVMRAWQCLRRYSVDVNVMCTVHAANVDRPLEIYKFFRDEMGAQFIQFIPIVERATPETLHLANEGWGGRTGTDRPLYRQEGKLVTERSVKAVQFGRFLTAIFDEWVKRDVGRVFVNTFDVALGSWVGQHNSCIVSPTCGGSLAMEHGGDVYSCDHFVEPDYYLGNIRDTPLGKLVRSDKQRQFGAAKYETLPKYCKECPVLFACYGECPRNRFIRTPDGEEGLNYLCAGYREFFTHVAKPMQRMAELLNQGRYADEIMQDV